MPVKSCGNLQQNTWQPATVANMAYCGMHLVGKITVSWRAPLAAWHESGDVGYKFRHVRAPPSSPILSNPKALSLPPSQRRHPTCIQFVQTHECLAKPLPMEPCSCHVLENRLMLGLLVMMAPSSPFLQDGPAHASTIISAASCT